MLYTLLLLVALPPPHFKPCSVWEVGVPRTFARTTVWFSHKEYWMFLLPFIVYNQRRGETPSSPFIINSLHHRTTNKQELHPPRISFLARSFSSLCRVVIHLLVLCVFSNLVVTLFHIIKRHRKHKHHSFALPQTKNRARPLDPLNGQAKIQILAPSSRRRAWHIWFDDEP